MRNKKKDPKNKSKLTVRNGPGPKPTSAAGAAAATTISEMLLEVAMVEMLTSSAISMHCDLWVCVVYLFMKPTKIRNQFEQDQQIAFCLLHATIKNTCKYSKM